MLKYYQSSDIRCLGRPHRVSNTELWNKKVGEVTVLHVGKGIPGSGDCMLRDPKRGEGAAEREPVKGVGVWIRKGYWPEKWVNRIVKNFMSC